MPIERSPKKLWKAAIQCIIKTIRHRKDRTVNHFVPNLSTLKFYEENFKMLHRKFKKTGQSGNDEFYNKIIFLNKIDDLYLWASHVQSVMEKESKVPEKKTGFFGFFGKKTNAETKVVEETYTDLFKEIENSPLPQNSLLPKDYTKIRFGITLGNGVFKLTDSALGEAGLVFTYKGLSSAASFKVEGFQAQLKMEDLSLFSEKDSKVIVQKVSQEQYLWQMNFESMPNRALAWTLENTFESLEVNYSLNFMQSVFSFFVVPKTQESAKIVAWDTLKGIQDTTQGALTDLLDGDTQYLIKIQCSAPRIKIPSPTQQGFFTVNLGNIYAENLPGEDAYENFNIFVSSLGMTYSLNNEKIHSVVPDFEIASSVKILKNKFKYKPKNELPELIFLSKLPDFKIIWNASVYHQLLRLPEVFNFLSESGEAKDLEVALEGTLKKLTPGLHAWKEFDSKLVGSYLYFGNTSFFYIKDCSIVDASEEYQQENTLKLTNIYGECVLAFPTKTDKEQWLYTLNEVINKFESRTSMATSLTTKDSSRVLYKFEFEVSTAQIQITDERQKPVSRFQFNKLVSSIQAREYDFKFSGTLGQMMVLEESDSKFKHVFRSLDQREMIEIHISHIDSKSKDYKNKGLVVEITGGNVEINWNFELLTEILNFFQFAEYSDPTRMIEDTLGVVDKDHVLLELNIELKSLALALINHKNKLAIAEVKVSDFISGILIQSEGYKITGTLDKLEINDLTNYPQTAIKGEIKPYKIFSVRDGGELLKFSIEIYSESNLKRDLDVSSKLEVELGRLDINYLHQPVMRIVDYLNYHILGVFDTQSRARKIDRNSIIKPRIVDEKLGFTSISVKINEPIVHIPPRPGHANQLSINLGVINVKNSLNKSLNPGWEDIYSIDMQNMFVFSKEKQISEQFEVTLSVTRKILTSEHLQIPSLDKAYLIKGNSKGIKLSLSQRDYNLILRTSDLNMLYDDHLESFISPTYQYTPPTPDKFMLIDFSIPSISVFLSYKSTQILEFLCISTHIHFTKFNDSTILFTFSSSNVLGLISESSVTSKSHDLKSMAELVFSLSAESLKAFAPFLPSIQPFILFGPTKEPQKNLLEIKLRTDMKTNKLIDVDIACVRINFHLSLFYQILNYFVSGVPNYLAASDTPQDHMTKFKSADFELADYCAPQIKANVNLTDSFIYLPSTSINRSLVAKSDLSFLYLREREGDPGPTNVKRLILTNLAIFQTKNEFQAQAKRKLVEPLQFIYEVKHFEQDIKENYVIGSLNCALSYRDLVSIQSTYKYQEEVMAKDESIINLLFGFDNLQVVEDRMSLNGEEHLTKTQTRRSLTLYSFAGLSVIIINDALTAYTPILDLSVLIGDNLLKKEESDGKSCFQGALQVSSSYYNPVADVWEPFVEPFFIETELVSSKNESIQSQYIFSIPSEVLNINFSEVMVKNLQEILQIWDLDNSQCNEVISPFQIKNELGYTVMVEYKHTDNVVIVESGCSQDYVIDYYARDKNSWKSDSIRVSIYPGDFAPPKLKIKTNKVQCYSCVTAKNTLVVDIELKSTRKILTIRSPLVFENLTDFFITVQFVKTGKLEIRGIEPKSSVAVPYDLITGVCSFWILENKTENTLNLEDLWKKGFNSLTEIKIGSFFLCLLYKISKVSSNKRTLYIKPPISIKNCIPNNLSLRLYRGGQPNKFEELMIKEQETIENYSYSIKTEMYVSVSLENYARSNLLQLITADSPTSIKVIDRKQQELTINIHRKIDGNLFIAFYVSQIIINNSLNPLGFYHKQKNTEKLFPGQDFVNNVLACNNTKKLIIGLGNQRSRAFKTDSVGIKDIIELIGDTNPAGHSFKYQYTLDIEMSKIIENTMIFCKVIVISPRFLLVNNSNIDIVVAQHGFCEYPVHLAQNSRLPFHWAHKDGKELVRFKGKADIWNWSGAFSIDNLGSFSVQCKNKSEVSSFLLMKVEIRIVDTTAHVIFEPEQLQTATYKIANESTLFSLAIYQNKHPEDIRFIDACTKCIFTWSDHLDTHEIIINFLIGKSASENNDTQCMYILNLDKMNQMLKIKIKNAPQDFDVLYVNVINEGPTRVIKFSDMPTQNSKLGSDVILAYFSFRIPKLGLSVIEHSKNKSKELFYFTFSEIILLAQNTGKEYKAELMVKSVQGDNQMSPDAIFPVIVHPADETIRYILHMCFVVNKESSVNCVSFETFEFLLLTLHLKLDTHCVRKLIELADRLFLKEQLGNLESTLNQYKENKHSSEIIRTVTKYYYFTFFKIHPIKIITTYAPLKYEGGKKDLLSGIASFGMALSSIEEAPIKLYPVNLRDAFASEKRIKDSLKSHYKSQLVNEFYSLIGHSNILGNPIGLLNDLGTGVVDFFYEPAQGMVNGPISATEGLIKGTGSLIKNTVSGTFGTVSKITSGITTGLAALTQDSDYIEERQKNLAKHKPSNVVTGVGLGVFSFFKNIGQGITGIVTEPIKGFKKDKMEGMVKGGLRGLGGLVVKPVAGVFDMVSRSAEGIKNTANFNDSVKYIKQRYPRVTYGPLRLLQVYNDEDSILLQHLFQIKKYKYYNKEFLEHVAGTNSDDKPIILAYFADLMMYITRHNGKIKWKVYYKNIVKTEIKGQNLQICVNKAKKNVWYKVDFKSEQMNKETFVKLDKLR